MSAKCTFGRQVGGRANLKHVVHVAVLPRGDCCSRDLQTKMHFPVKFIYNVLRYVHCQQPGTESPGLLPRTSRGICLSAMMRSPSSPRRSRQLTCRPPHSSSRSCGSLRHVRCSAGACWLGHHAPPSAQLCLCAALPSQATLQASRGAPLHTSSPPQAPRPLRAPLAPAAGPAPTGASCISTIRAIAGKLHHGPKADDRLPLGM